jgi:hypothetical protein
MSLMGRAESILAVIAACPTEERNLRVMELHRAEVTKKRANLTVGPLI